MSKLVMESDTLTLADIEKAIKLIKEDKPYPTEQVEVFYGPDAQKEETRGNCRDYDNRVKHWLGVDFITGYNGSKIR